eukprot:COSAG05_NODE_375_length_10634_cov_14.790603_1_plen_147_part_10
MTTLSSRARAELEPVRLGMGGTSFLSGSHKLSEPYGGPDPYRPNVHGSPWSADIRAAMETYACPAGSVVVWCESTVHMGNQWTNPDNERITVLQAYNALWAQFCWARISHEQIMRMPPRRRSLFRATWQISGGNAARDASMSVEDFH